MSKSVVKLTEEVCIKKLKDIENIYKADVISINGPMEDAILDVLMPIIERLRRKSKYKNKTLYVILTTNGGSATAVERIVHLFRVNYDEVNFIVPDYAYSAGTILCMSGDNIFMDGDSTVNEIDKRLQSM